MKLSKICEKIKYECLQGSMEAEVRDIIYDSRKIAKETMFVCMVGAVTDGHKYIPDAGVSPQKSMDIKNDKITIYSGCGGKGGKRHCCGAR